jgi:hypothetical protein
VKHNSIPICLEEKVPGVLTVTVPFMLPIKKRRFKANVIERVRAVYEWSEDYELYIIKKIEHHRSRALI